MFPFLTRFVILHVPQLAPSDTAIRMQIKRLSNELHQTATRPGKVSENQIFDYIYGVTQLDLPPKKPGHSKGEFVLLTFFRTRRTDDEQITFHRRTDCRDLAGVCSWSEGLVTKSKIAIHPRTIWRR
jgi:hypothetical protein